VMEGGFEESVVIGPCSMGGQRAREAPINDLTILKIPRIVEHSIYRKLATKNTSNVIARSLSKQAFTDKVSQNRVLTCLGRGTIWMDRGSSQRRRGRSSNTGSMLIDQKICGTTWLYPQGSRNTLTDDQDDSLGRRSMLVAATTGRSSKGRVSYRLKLFNVPSSA
jgi:hypothetical protein